MDQEKELLLPVALLGDAAAKKKNLDHCLADNRQMQQQTDFETPMRWTKGADTGAEFLTRFQGAQMTGKTRLQVAENPDDDIRLTKRIEVGDETLKQPLAPKEARKAEVEVPFLQTSHTLQQLGAPSKRAEEPIRDRRLATRDSTDNLNFSGECEGRYLWDHAGLLLRHIDHKHREECHVLSHHSG